MTTAAPATFEHYEAENAYGLLGQLHDLAVSPTTGLDQDLTVIAMAAAVVSWWGRWQPGMVHRALVAGASVDQVVAATGRPMADLYQAWRVFARGQVGLYEDCLARGRAHPLGMAPGARDQVEALFVGALAGEGGPLVAATG